MNPCVYFNPTEKQISKIQANVKYIQAINKSPLFILLKDKGRNTRLTSKIKYKIKRPDQTGLHIVHENKLTIFILL